MQGLVPRGLSRTLPQLAALESFDVPVWGDAKLDLSSTGEILGGTIGIDAAPGQVLLPWLVATPLRIDGGHLALSYNRATRRFEIAPSVIVWGDSRVQFTGSIVHTAQGPEGPGWSFDVNSAGGWIGAEPPLLPRLDLDNWSARGFFSPERGQVVLSQFQLRAGGAEVSAQGDVRDMAGAMQAHLDGKIGPMPASLFKTLWPAPLAPHARDWIVRRLVRGWVQGGTFWLTSGTGGDSGWAARAGRERGSLTLEGTNLAFAVIDSWPALDVPRALVRLDGQTFEMTAPEATFAVPDGRKLALKGAFTVDMTEPLPRTGRVAFRGQGPLSLALEMLDRRAVPYAAEERRAPPGIDGKIDGQLTVSMPLGRPLEPGDVTVEGKTRISEGRLGHTLGPYEVHGANVAIDMTTTAVEARGDMLINGGVVAKASWQHVFAAPADKQPPLRISAILDNSYRNQLGLDINDHGAGRRRRRCDGLARSCAGERRVHLRADLLNAEVVLESVAWRKPKGRASVFEFDVVKGGATYPTELHNVRLVGDNVAIEGWMGIGADNKLKEFRFPNFSLNVVTSLETHGKVRPDGIWDVSAKGPTYDGRDLFRSFFDVAHLGDQSTKVRPGLDLRAEVDTVVGFSDTTLRNVKMFMQKRSNKLTWLDARGVLEGGKPFAAEVRHEAGQSRRLLRRGHGRGPALQARRLLSQCGRRRRQSRGRPRRPGPRGAHRHALGARLPRAGRPDRQRGAAERRQHQTSQRAAHGPSAARAVRVRDHARAFLGRPRPVRDARRRHQRPAGERVLAGQGRLQGADAQCRRHLCADVGPHAGAGPDTGDRAAAHGSARRRHIRHHLRHPGLDGKAAGDGEPALDHHSRHLPRDFPDDAGGSARAAARSAGPEGRRRARLQRAGGQRAGGRIGRTGRDAGSRRQLVGGDQRRRREKEIGARARSSTEQDSRFVRLYCGRGQVSQSEATLLWRNSVVRLRGGVRLCGRAPDRASCPFTPLHQGRT